MRGRIGRPGPEPLQAAASHPITRNTPSQGRPDRPQLRVGLASPELSKLLEERGRRHGDRRALDEAGSWSSAERIRDARRLSGSSAAGAGSYFYSGYFAAEQMIREARALFGIRHRIGQHLRRGMNRAIRLRRRLRFASTLRKGGGSARGRKAARHSSSPKELCSGTDCVSRLGGPYRRN